jgi:hypothetical protein
LAGISPFDFLFDRESSDGFFQRLVNLENHVIGVMSPS